MKISGKVLLVLIVLVYSANCFAGIGLKSANPEEKQSANNHLSVNLSVFYPLSINKNDSVSTNFNLSWIYGKVGSVYGVDLSGCVSLVKRDVRGYEGAGLVNIVGGNMVGFQDAGLMNHVEANLKGWQGAGIYNHVVGNASFFQSAGIVNNVAGDFKGLQASGITNILKGSLTGMS